MQTNVLVSDIGGQTATLEMTDVSFFREGNMVLKDIGFLVREKRIGIVGRNGSGKTTLARILSGLAVPDQGRVRICGVDVAKDRKAALRTVGIMFQNPDHQIIFPTVEEELGFGLLQMGHSKPEVEQQVSGVLDDFDKNHWAKASIHQLSQGQKQLVCLMAIIVMKPKVVILDEPFSGLDIPTRLQLTRYFDRIDAALIHISHSPESLQSYERVIWLDKGQIRQDGPACATLTDFSRQMNDVGGLDDISDLTG
ncbi:energy-coupling factor ABC transporter ATP-binding protein [Sedimentitalea todarodis]|uniref:ABC transporter ATP-binding protein n=1 Tax=Sedimentitalea todarodis TaxID=1631240 RepID=A0ABU3VKI8_9RHOB|nr:ABC transporter ATP-binding protein [Sedimentitalea todarodis]MDU9006695.1 ABC transporter ATP-binding protein [Sedimentitalea todarodis]